MGTATTISRRRGWRSLLAAAVALVALAVPAAAQTALPEFPRLSGRVVDEADILPVGTRVELISRLATLEAKTSDQVVVVTLRSLRGRPIELYGILLARHWGIGQRGQNNGVLLIVAPSERKARIEVGYGLEGTLTDAVAKYIIDQTILPHFRASDMAGGIARGTEDIAAVLTGDAAEWQSRAATFAASSAPTFAQRVNRLFGFSGGLGMGIVFAMFCLAILAAVGWMFVGAIVELLRWIGALPKRRNAAPFYRNERRSGVGTDAYSGVSPSMSSSIGSEGFSGGGGDFGGGGASGSW
jgi:uncharacterized protein